MSSRFREAFLITLLFGAIVLSVTIGTGTMTSGWHFVDDHEIAEWYTDFFVSGRSYASVVRKWWAIDFMNRFEPLYYPMRIGLVRLFGMNLTLFSAFYALLTIFTMVFLYLSGRELGGHVLPCILFAVVSLTGYQSAAWWKLGPQEIPCSFFFALGFFFEIRGLRGGRKRDLCISFVFFLLMSMLKESFILLLPFCAWFCLQETLPRRKTGSGYTVLAGRPGRACALYMAGILAVFLTCIILIVLFVGTDEYSGAGVSLGIPLRQYLSSYLWAFTHDLRFFAAAALGFGSVLLTFWEPGKALLPEVTGLFIFLGPQLVLYGKEAMSERYLLPSAIGFSLFFFVLVGRTGILAGRRRVLYRCIGLFLCATGLQSAVSEADYFSYRGRSVTAALEETVDIGMEDGCVVSCLGYCNPEADFTMTDYTRAYEVNDCLYFWNEKRGCAQKTEPFYHREDGTRLDLEDADLIIAYNKKDRHYTGTPALLRNGAPEGFKKVACGTLTLYTREDGAAGDRVLD